MNPILKQFYENSSEREAVREFLIESLKEMAVERVFSKGAVAGIYEGRKAIDKAFDKLQQEYGIVKKADITSQSR